MLLCFSTIFVSDSSLSFVLNYRLDFSSIPCDSKWAWNVLIDKKNKAQSLSWGLFQVPIKRKEKKQKNGAAGDG